MPDDPTAAEPFRPTPETFDEAFAHDLCRAIPERAVRSGAGALPAARGAVLVRDARGPRACLRRAPARARRPPGRFRLWPRRDRPLVRARVRRSSDRCRFLSNRGRRGRTSGRACSLRTVRRRSSSPMREKPRSNGRAPTRSLASTCCNCFPTGKQHCVRQAACYAGTGGSSSRPGSSTEPLRAGLPCPTSVGSPRPPASMWFSARSTRNGSKVSEGCTRTRSPPTAMTPSQPSGALAEEGRSFLPRIADARRVLLVAARQAD